MQRRIVLQQLPVIQLPHDYRYQGLPGCWHDLVTGPYQIIVDIELEDLTEMGKIIADRIATIPGVDRWRVCVALSGTQDQA